MKIQNPNKEELYSLFIQFHNNELPLSTSKKIKKIIHECEECQQIYDDIVDFFDEGEAIIYELKNPLKVESLRKKARKIATQNTISNDATISNKYEVNLDNFHCCDS